MRGSAIRTLGKVVGAAGLFGVAIIAPNAIQAFEKLSRMHKGKQSRSYADYLKRSGYFEARQEGDRFVIRLSDKGRDAFTETLFADFEFPVDQVWQEKWHILMFDIPESHRNIRKYVSGRLQALGLRPIQDSVYVYPHDLNDLAHSIRQTYPKIASLILSARVDKIDGEDQLRKAFNL